MMVSREYRAVRINAARHGHGSRLRVSFSHYETFSYRYQDAVAYSSAKECGGDFSAEETEQRGRGASMGMALRPEPAKARPDLQSLQRDLELEHEAESLFSCAITPLEIEVLFLLQLALFLVSCPQIPRKTVSPRFCGPVTKQWLEIAETITISPLEPDLQH